MQLFRSSPYWSGSNLMTSWLFRTFFHWATRPLNSNSPSPDEYHRACIVNEEFFLFVRLVKWPNLRLFPCNFFELIHQYSLSTFQLFWAIRLPLRPSVDPYKGLQISLQTKILSNKELKTANLCSFVT